MSHSYANQVEDALADLEAHIYATGQTVIEFISQGLTANNAINKVAEMTNESFDFVKTSTISVLEQELEFRSK